MLDYRPPRGLIDPEPEDIEAVLIARDVPTSFGMRPGGQKILREDLLFQRCNGVSRPF